MGIEIPRAASFTPCGVRASRAPAPCLVAFCLSPEDLFSGFEAAEILAVQLGLAATSGYGKNPGNSISGLGNSRSEGPEAALKGSMSGGQKGEQCG